MSIQIADTHNTGVLTVRQTNSMGSGAVYLTPREQVEVLEALARVHGYTLIDRDERRELLAQAADRPDEPLPDEPWTRWPATYKALVAAVHAALRTSDPKEI